MLSGPLVQLNYANINMLEDLWLRRQISTWLSPSELQRLAQFGQPQQADQYLLARGMLRYQLSQHYPEYLPQQWQLTVDTQGKPHLGPLFSHLNIHFNLSHSEDMVVVVISDAGAAGVDIESVSRSVFSLALAERYFADSEVRLLQSLPVQQQAQRIVQLWTLKESFLKAEGLGLRVPLRKVSFYFSDQNPLRLELSSDCHDISVSEKTAFSALYQLGDDHSLALSVKTNRAVCASDVQINPWSGLRQNTQAQHCQLITTT